MLKKFFNPKSLFTILTATGQANALVIKPNATMVQDLRMKCRAYFLPANYTNCFDYIAKVFFVISKNIGIVVIFYLYILLPFLQILLTKSLHIDQIIIQQQLSIRKVQQKYLTTTSDEVSTVAKIIFSMSTSFLTKFFQLSLPEPGERCLGGADAKSDLKLLLQIATHSRLKQGQDKKNQNRQIFYCRSLGKECFKIEVEFFKDGCYEVLDDYTMMKHRDGCQKTGQSPNVIKIYNLMMLKRALIQDFMEKQELEDSSPELILQKISGDNGEYFYCQQITDLESRRKLKKRFDNIINISIKKKKETRSKAEQLDKLKLEKSQKTHRKGGRNKRKLQEWEKQNVEFQNLLEREQNSGKPSFKQLQKIGSQRVRSKLDSNSSINFYRNYENDEQKYRIPSQIFPLKNDSIFESEEEDYFRKKSDLYIKMNMLNDMGSNNIWPESEHSIGGNSGGLKVDDLFASLIRNSLMKSLEKRSLTEIDPNIADSVPNPQDSS